MSIINKVLNEVDNKEAHDEVKPEVSFLLHKQYSTIKRSNTWWLRLGSGVLTLIVAFVAAYLYYPNLVEVSDSLDLVRPQEQSLAAATKTESDNKSLPQYNDHARLDNSEKKAVEQVEEIVEEVEEIVEQIQVAHQVSEQSQVSEQRFASPVKLPKWRYAVWPCAVAKL